MLNFIDQTSIHFEELSAMQFGWEAEFTQLGPAERASRVNLVRSDNAGICHFEYNSKFDQRMYILPDYYSFGLLEVNTTRAMVQGNPLLLVLWSHSQARTRRMVFQVPVFMATESISKGHFSRP